MRTILCCVLSTLFLNYVTPFALPFEGEFDLDIIHYNDFHARFEETSVDTPTCRYNNNSCIGGFPRLYREIQVLLEEKPDALVLNAGDSFQGTYWYTLLKWNVTQEFMNMIPHDAHAIGNHEFDDGPHGLAPYLQALKAPVLVANMDTRDEPSLEGLYKKHIIVERKGRKIGLLGLITPDTKSLSSPGNVTFTDPKVAARREAEALLEKGADIIILLSHCGLEVDKEIARDVGEHIDIIVGGHSHSLLWNGDTAPSGEEISGKYPVFVETTPNLKHKVVIVQASSFTKYMGNLTVTFDARGQYVKWAGGPLYLDRSIPEDKEIKKKLEPYAKLVHAAENVLIGENMKTMRSDDCAYGECTIGDLLADALIKYTKRRIYTERPCISFIQRGNIKASILKGPITAASIFEVLPFNDKVLTFEIIGKHIRAALLRSVSEAWGYKPFKGPWVLQQSGLQVTYNESLPEALRLVSVYVGKFGSTEPLEDYLYYQVTAPSYLAYGGDGYYMFKEGINHVVVERDQEVLERYIKDYTPIDVKLDGRIVINS